MRKPLFAIADQCTISGTNFLISLALARGLDEVEYGLYVFGFTTLIITEGLQNNLVSAPIHVISSKKSDNEWKVLIYHSIIYYLFISLFVISVLSICYLFLNKNFSKNASVLLNLSVTSVLFLGSELIRKSLLSKIHIINALILDIFAYSVRLLVLPAVFFLNMDSAVMALHFISLGSLISILIGFRMLDLELGAVKLSKNVIKEIFEYGKWTLLDWLPFVLAGQLYVFIVTFVLGNDSTGVLGATRNFVAPVSIMLVGIMNYALPYFSAIYTNGGELALKRKLSTGFFVFICGITVYLVLINIFASDLLEMIYGKYREATIIVMLLSIGIFINTLFKPFDIFIRVTSKPRYLFYSRMGSSLISVLFCYPLVKLYGIPGAAFSYILSQAGMLVFIAYFVRKLTQKS